MSKKSPQLRFEGFTDDWEERKLGDTETHFTDGNYGESYPSAKDMSDKANGIPFLRGSDFSNGYLDSSNANYIKPEKHAELTSGHIKQDDIVLAVRGSLGTLGYATKENEGWNINSQLAILRTNKSEISGMFLIQYLLGSKGQKEIFSRNTGTALKQLPIKQLKDIPVPVPTLLEQQKIGNFFKELDSTIALHQRKLDLLKEQKKGYLQKMFPKTGEKIPELRFAGFADDWEERKWIDTVDMSTNMVNPKTGDYDDLLHIGPGNIESFTGRILDNVNTVKNDNLISGKFHFNPNDIIYGKINPQLAKYVHVDFEGLASADAYVLNSKNGVNQGFLFVELQTSGFYKYSVSVSMRTGMPKINRDELNQFSYLAPKNIEEQQRIGSFFKQLDETIALHQRKLDLLKEQKKGYLQKMFV